MDIERAYQGFYRNYIQFGHDIDFIGVNISTDSETPLLFKTYQHIDTCIKQFDPFLSLLNRNNMIKYYLPIITSDKNRVQYDVRLNNRSDGNMAEVLSFLSDSLSLSELLSDSALSEMEYFSKMNITAQPGYSMSSLYFLGLQWNQGVLTSLKSHYLTRKVNNPDHFSDGFWYDDGYFLTYIRTFQSSICYDLSKFAEDVLSQLQGHLWMFGIDILNTSEKKYKIYIFNPNGFDLEVLLQAVKRYRKLTDASYILNQLRRWSMYHHELLLYGFAITATTNEAYGLNLYFIPPKSLRGSV